MRTMKTDYYCVEISAHGKAGTYEPIGVLEPTMVAVKARINFYRVKYGEHLHFRISKFMRVEV
jgi:hypothetical protein